MSYLCFFISDILQAYKPTKWEDLCRILSMFLIRGEVQSQLSFSLLVQQPSTCQEQLEVSDHEISNWFYCCKSWFFLIDLNDNHFFLLLSWFLLQCGCLEFCVWDPWIIKKRNGFLNTGSFRILKSSFLITNNFFIYFMFIEINFILCTIQSFS